MATINRKTSNPNRTYEGAMAAMINPEQQLRRLTMAALLWEDSFYVDGVSHAELVKQAVAQCRPDFVAELAVEIRNKGKLRHMPLLLALELARLRGLKADTLAEIIQRPDELTEFLALYWQDGRLILQGIICWHLE